MSRARSGWKFRSRHALPANSTCARSLRGFGVASRTGNTRSVAYRVSRPSTRNAAAICHRPARQRPRMLPRLWARLCPRRDGADLSIAARPRRGGLDCAPFRTLGETHAISPSLFSVANLSKGHRRQQSDGRLRSTRRRLRAARRECSRITASSRAPSAVLDRASTMR